MEVLAHLESGEAKLLGVMVENLAKDVTRVEGGVNDINRKMDILTRIDLTTALTSSRPTATAWSR